MHGSIGVSVVKPPLLEPPTQSPTARHLQVFCTMFGQPLTARLRNQDMGREKLLSRSNLLHPRGLWTGSLDSLSVV
jgi:hypothetical protein